MARVRTVEYEPGWGWIARDPKTGKEIMEEGFRWSSRSIARAVVDECRVIDKMKAKSKKRRKQ